jgi:hypothetical protein
MRRILENPGLCSIDDPLFPDTGGGAGDPPPKTPANGGDPNPTTGISMAEAAELVTQAQAPLLEKIETLSEATAKLAQNATANQQNQTTPDPQGDGDFLTEFSQDPEKAVKTLMRGEMGAIAPLIGNLMNSGTSAFVGIEAQAVDQEFGSGAWATLFDKPMNTIIDSYRTNNMAALADRNTITREVNMLKGQLIDKLIEHKTNAAKVTAEQTEADRKTLTDTITDDVTQRTGMTGGIRRHEAGAAVITEDIKGYVEERQRAIGGTEGAKEFMERTEYGNTLEDYLAHQKTMKEKE